MNYKLSTASLDRLKDVNPTLIKIALAGIVDSPYEFQIPPFGGRRTAEEQHGLFLKKVSKCDGFNDISEHQKGTAFDIFVLIDGKASWDKKYYKPIADHLIKIAKEQFNTQLTWGGSWVKFPDAPHFQINKQMP
jgi:peptidoglycan L-alanyl-D-glutamate endopeptidase CwlK